MVNRRRSPGPRPGPARQAPTTAEVERRRLVEATVDAQRLMNDLSGLMAEQVSRGPQTGTIGRHAPESSEPWNSEAAGPFWTIWFGVRRLASRLEQECGTRQSDWSGGGYPVTSRAFKTIRDLATSAPESMIRLCATRLERWTAAARRIRDIDEEDAWVPVPRAPGLPPPICPYCRTLSLRMAKAREIVRCFFPQCTDLDGRPTQARMEPGAMTGSGTLVFGDGTVVSYREESS